MLQTMFLSAFVLYGSSYDLRPSRWSFHGQALFAHFAQQSDDEVPQIFQQMDGPKLVSSHKCSAELLGNLLYRFDRYL